MKPSKKTKKTLLERVLGTPQIEIEQAPQPPDSVIVHAAKVVADAGISPEHAPHVAQLISTSLSTQSSLTRETY